MKTKMEQPVQSAPFTERELMQQDVISDIDKSIGYSTAILDVMDLLKDNGVIDLLDLQQQLSILKLNYNKSKHKL